ncbi:MAG: hypothetical protein V4640_09035 [Verrucomicrobiota bacterium]
MTLHLRSTTLSLLLALAGLVSAKDTPIQIRALLNDSVNRADFYFGTPGKAMTQVELAVEGLTQPQKITPVGGVLNLFDSAQVTAANAKTHLAATMKVPAGSKSLIVIIVPVADQKPPYRMVAIPDDARSFPWNTNKVVNLTSMECLLEIGEMKLDLPADKVTDVPKLTHKGDTNQLQTNFSYKQNEQWQLATERRLQYVDNLRRIFVIHKQPQALGPEVRTIQDEKLTKN